jgi:hypothetical protein
MNPFVAELLLPACYHPANFSNMPATCLQHGNNKTAIKQPENPSNNYKFCAFIITIKLP